LGAGDKYDHFVCCWSFAMNAITHTAAVMLVAVASAVTLAACSGERTSAPAPGPLPVLVTTVRQGMQSEQRVLTATVRARVETELGFRVAGRITQRLVDVGDRVGQGQALARLDAADYTLGVEAATDQMRAAATESEQTASEEARLRRLLTDGSVSTTDHERQKARADAAAARLDQMRRGLELARNRAAYATLLAPYAGIVTTLRMEAGQVVAEGQAVATLARDGEREVVVDLPETLVKQVRRMQATATLWQGDGPPLALRLREVSPMASSVGGTFRVRYAMAAQDPSAARELPLGATARVLLTAEGAQGAVLPVSALVKASAEVGVWEVTGVAPVLVFRPVQVQAYEADTVRVSGLAPGARVVTVGAQKLDAAMKVTPVERRTDEAMPDPMIKRVAP
jgi:RND family efflux transporter MFP subunit